MKPNPTRSALLVIDMENGFVHPEGGHWIRFAQSMVPNCIRTTCYDALSLDYDVVVLSDCTSSVTDEVQSANLRDMARIGARICTGAELPTLLGEARA